MIKFSSTRVRVTSLTEKSDNTVAVTLAYTVDVETADGDYKKVKKELDIHLPEAPMGLALGAEVDLQIAAGDLSLSGAPE